MVSGDEDLNDPEVRRRVLRKVIRAPSHKSTEFLATSLPNLDVNARADVLLALVRTGSCLEAVAHHARVDPEPRIRVLCVGNTHPGVARASETLRAVLHDTDARVVAAALRQVRLYHLDELGGAIESLLTAADWSVRFEACRALLELGRVNETLVGTVSRLAQEAEASTWDKYALRSRLPEVLSTSVVSTYPPTVGELQDAIQRALSG
jgi:hypothetical protein